MFFSIVNNGIDRDNVKTFSKYVFFLDLYIYIHKLNFNRACHTVVANCK